MLYREIPINSVCVPASLGCVSTGSYFKITTVFRSDALVAMISYNPSDAFFLAFSWNPTSVSRSPDRRGQTEKSLARGGERRERGKEGRVNLGLGEIRISSLWRESDTGSHRATKISKARSRSVIVFHPFSLLQIKMYNDLNSLSSSHREEVNYGR